ncbi:MAG: hypothetical protein NTW95_05765 [Candidatus Aminicenantes bacterium]|nr:hypothetical protein [Candidatus Aminicenantes bacterium]
MKTVFQFSGKWLIRYEPGEFTFHALLAALHRLQVFLEQQGLEHEFLNVRFNRNITLSRFYADGTQLCIEYNGSDKQLVESAPGAFPCPAALEPLAKPIRSLNLLFPRCDNDPRWKTMGLPAAQLFLASNLQAKGFQPAPMPLRLPSPKLPPGALSADMAGFTIFEDLLPALRPFLADFQAQYGGWLAAGGPFPTLHPLAAVYHLPQINLFIRGEAELELPVILEALNRGDASTLFERKGWFWQKPGLIAMSAFDEIVRPENFSRFQVDLAFMQREHLRHGLEMNFSRGCGRGCLFCCHVQGSKLRQLPLTKAEDLLKAYKDKVNSKGVPLERPDCILGMPIHDMPGRPAGSPLPPVCIPVNINDDDILQDPAYAAAVFALIKKSGFRIHGIQTSPVALVHNDGRANEEILALVADPELYLDSRPLLWLGSDVFLPQRGQRLGKRLPSLPAFADLLARLEKYGLRHYHYWISSDNDSTWEEFVTELALIIAYHRDFPNFSLLAHAPFIVPYPASRLCQSLPANTPKLMIREVFRAADPEFSFVLPERLETGFVNLNRLLRNEKADGEAGFFDLLKTKDLIAAAQLAYHFLKQEALQRPAVEKELLEAQHSIASCRGRFAL